jgi:hypothetical protein
VIWWIVGGLVVGSLLLLTLAAVALLGRAREFGHASRRVQRQVAEVERRLLPKVAALRERAEKLQAQLMAVQERAARLQAARARQKNG